MKRILALGLAALLFLSCGKNPNPAPADIAKKIRVEVAFTGDTQFYKLIFSINSFSKSNGAFVTPLITVPAGTSWTKDVSVGYNHIYTGPVLAPTLVLVGSEPASEISFTLSTFQNAKTDSTISLLKATVRVLADDKVVQTYSYEALPFGQVTQPLSETIDLASK